MKSLHTDEQTGRWINGRKTTGDQKSSSEPLIQVSLKPNKEKF